MKSSREPPRRTVSRLRRGSLPAYQCFCQHISLGQVLTLEEYEAARQRLQRHAGAVCSGDFHSAENERIDSDLADEYHSNHEGEHLCYWTPLDKVTHSYVLAEFVPLRRVRGLRHQDTLRFLAALMDSPLLELVWVDERLHRAAHSYLEAHLDKRYSLCDAKNFVLMQERGLVVVPRGLLSFRYVPRHVFVVVRQEQP